MKMGEFSEKVNISVDTIRYYISLGLLVPEQRDSKRYTFTDKDVSDAEEILRLKELRFSIKEMQTLMRLKRTSSANEPMFAMKTSAVYKDKKNALQRELRQIKKAIIEIDEKIESYKNIPAMSNAPEIGVPLRALPILKCPNCGKMLQITQATFSGNYVMEGCLSCDCGFYATIENGVIITGNEYTAPYDTPDIDRNLYGTLCDGVFYQYQQCSKHIMNGLLQLNLKNKVVLEGNINGYFFLYKNFENLPKDCLFIVVDKFKETLFMYKRLLESMNVDRDILFIADASAEYPIEKGCVDVLVNFFGTNEWMLYHENTYEEDIDPYLSDKCAIVGSFISLPQNAITIANTKKKYTEASSRMFSFSKYINTLSKLGFTCETTKSGEVTHTQNSFAFTCHVEGEPYIYNKLVAKRSQQTHTASF